MPELWHRRRDLGEKKGQYDAFTHFRDQPPGARTVDGAYRLHRKQCRSLPDRDGVEAPGIWRKWKQRFQWDDRVDAHDAAIEDETRRDRLAAIKKANEQDAAIGAAGMAKVVEGLTTLQGSKLSPGQLVLLMKEASALRRRALGQPTDHVRQEHAGSVRVETTDELTDFYNELTEDERTTFRAVLERRAAKSAGGAEGA